MLKLIRRGAGRYDDPMRRLPLRIALASPARRSSTCSGSSGYAQIDEGESSRGAMTATLVPAFLEALATTHPGQGTLEDIAGIAVALVPAPKASDAKDNATWFFMLAALAKAGGKKIKRTFSAARLGRRLRPLRRPAHDREGGLATPRRRASVRLARSMTAAPETRPSANHTVLGMNSYQWTVLFPAWLGWGFDVADGCSSTARPRRITSGRCSTWRPARPRPKKLDAALGRDLHVEYSCWAGRRAASIFLARSPITASATALV